MVRANRAPKINAKKFANVSKPCMKDMISFLNCLSLNQMNNEKCARSKELLGSCMDAQAANKKKSWGSLNFQLLRLSKARK